LAVLKKKKNRQFFFICKSESKTTDFITNQGNTDTGIRLKIKKIQSKTIKCLVSVAPLEGGGHGQGKEDLTRKCVCKFDDSKISVATNGSVLIGGTEGDKTGRIQCQGSRGDCSNNWGLCLAVGIGSCGLNGTGELDVPASSISNLTIIVSLINQIYYITNESGTQWARFSTNPPAKIRSAFDDRYDSNMMCAQNRGQQGANGRLAAI
jgi:hypothetical protein